MAHLHIQQLSIVIPVYNEQDNILPLIDEINAVLTNQLTFEIIVIDDCSTDKTLAILKSARTSHPHLKVIRHHSNAGQSAALLTGVQAAQYEWVATLDGDGQNNPSDLPLLIAAIQDNDSICIGIRTKRQDSQLRKLSSMIANRVRNLMLKTSCPIRVAVLNYFHAKLF